MKFHESETVELKRTLTKDLAKEVVAFLNTRNGTIYIGVDDKGNILGVSNIDKTMREIRDIIRDQILPTTEGLCIIGSLLEDDKMVISVKVNKGSKLYYIKKEGRSATGCFYRDGTSSVPMSEDEIERRQIASLRDDKLSLIDIESHGDNFTFEILKIKLRNRGVEINDKTFERSFKLLTKDGKYNLLAELLADKNFYSIQVCIFNGNDKLSYSRRNNFGQQCLLQVYEDVKHYCEALNDTYIDDSGFPRRTKTMFNEKAFEEAWINALVHNDWIHGNPPSIYWYDDRMEIMSYGGLKEGLTRENFFDGVSDPVNKELMDIFVQCDIGDRSGHGVPKVIEAYGRDAFKFLGVGIMVTIPFDKKGFKKEEDSAETSHELHNNFTITSQQLHNNFTETSQKLHNNFTITSHELHNNFTESSQNFTVNEEKVIGIIEADNKITTDEIAFKIGLSRRAVQDIINILKSKGVLVRTGSRKRGYWQIVEKENEV